MTSHSPMHRHRKGRMTALLTCLASQLAAATGTWQCEALWGGTQPSLSLHYAPILSKAGQWCGLTSADLWPTCRLQAPEVQGTQVDHPSSSGCRTSTDHRCLSRCHQRLGICACSPGVAPLGLDDWAVLFHVQEGRRSSCISWPSLQHLRWSSYTTRHQNWCPAAEPVAMPCHVGPHQLAVPPLKMTRLTPWRACPPWGWIGVASTGLIGPSPHDQTLHQSPHVRQRCGLHQRECFGLESNPDPHHHRSLPGHHLRLQHHPHEPLHTGLSSSTWEGSDLLLDSWLPLVAWDGANLIIGCSVRWYFGHGCVTELWSLVTHLILQNLQRWQEMECGPPPCYLGSVPHPTL